MIKNRAIVFIQKDKFDYFDEAQSRIFQFVFQPNIIQDLEVADHDQVNSAIKTFVETNKLQPASLLFIFAEQITFEKTFALTAQINKNQEIQKFLDNIPFEQVGYKVIEGSQGFQVLAINEEIYKAFAFAFESLGFIALTVIPQSALDNVYRQSQSLTPDMVKHILSRFDNLQKQGFIQEDISSQVRSNGEEQTETTIKTSTSSNQAGINKYRIPALLSVFFILIGVLSYFVYIQSTQKSKASPVPSTIVAPPVETPTQTTEEPPPSTPSASPT